MRIGFFSESPADQAALAVFTETILGAPPEQINMPLEGHGFSGVLAALDGVIKGLHYNSDAEGLVVVVDCDSSELHSATHGNPDDPSDDCRLCEARRIVARTRKALKKRPTGPELKVAIGLAMPAIEAWYLVGIDPQVGEAALRVGLNEGRVHLTTRDYRHQLKKKVYGTERPSIELETEVAVREARRVCKQIGTLEAFFPDGFGPMAQEIRSWRAPPQPGAGTT